MTRGRKKDMTIPPSRSLDHQRAYRDRKAKYVSDLEERCRNAEAENDTLRRELHALKAGTADGREEGETERRTVRLYYVTDRVGGLIGIVLSLCIR